MINMHIYVYILDRLITFICSSTYLKTIRIHRFKPFAISSQFKKNPTNNTNLLTLPATGNVSLYRLSSRDRACAPAPFRTRLHQSWLPLHPRLSASQASANKSPQLSRNGEVIGSRCCLKSREEVEECRGSACSSSTRRTGPDLPTESRC